MQEPTSHDEESKGKEAGLQVLSFSGESDRKETFIGCYRVVLEQAAQHGVCIVFQQLTALAAALLFCRNVAGFNIFSSYFLKWTTVMHGLGRNPLMMRKKRLSMRPPAHRYRLGGGKLKLRITERVMMI